MDKAFWHKKRAERTHEAIIAVKTAKVNEEAERVATERIGKVKENLEIANENQRRREAIQEKII